LLLEVTLVLLNFLLEVLDLMVSLLLHLVIVLVDDSVGLRKTFEEFIPGIVKTSKVLLILLCKTTRHNSNVLLLLDDILELLADRVASII